MSDQGYVEKPMSEQIARGVFAQTLGLEPECFRVRHDDQKHLWTVVFGLRNQVALDDGAIRQAEADHNLFDMLGAAARELIKEAFAEADTLHASAFDRVPIRAKTRQARKIVHQLRTQLDAPFQELEDDEIIARLDELTELLTS